MVIFPQKVHRCERGVAGEVRGMTEEAKVPGKGKRERKKEKIIRKNLNLGKM